MICQPSPLSSSRFKSEACQCTFEAPKDYLVPAGMIKQDSTAIFGADHGRCLALLCAALGLFNILLRFRVRQLALSSASLCCRVLTGRPLVLSCPCKHVCAWMQVPTRSPCYMDPLSCTELHNQATAACA